MKLALNILLLLAIHNIAGAQDVVNLGDLTLPLNPADGKSSLLFLNSENELVTSDREIFENRVSITGDTLFLYGNIMIIPGISRVNLPPAQHLIDLGYSPREVVDLGASPLSLRGVLFQDGTIIDYDTTLHRGVIAANVLIGSSAGNAFGCSGVNYASQSTLYKGSSNTINILNACSGASAAQVISVYQSSNFSDWYLPSTSEIARARGVATVPSTYSFRFIWTSDGNVTNDFNSEAAYAWDSQSFNPSNDYVGRFRTESTNFGIWPMRTFTD